MKQFELSTNTSVVADPMTDALANGNNYLTNQACIDLLKESERLRLEAYEGPGMAEPWLIGYGHKTTARLGMTITESEAELLLKNDLVRVESAIQRLVTVDLNNNQFSALACFAYNMGTGNFATSTLLKNLN